MKHLTAIIKAMIVCLCTIASARGDCITEAAKCFQINPMVIKAIIWQESKNQLEKVNLNKNRTIDVGVMQINTIHFKSLNALGLNEDLLRKNSCANVFAGAWVLRNNIDHYGYTWRGIGNYHSKTPVHHDKYVQRIISLIANHTMLINKIEVEREEGIQKHFHCNR